MHAPSPLPRALPFPGYAPLDIEHDPFASELHWSADELARAVREPLHRQVLAPSASDARLHRPRRAMRFLATPAPQARFRIGG